MQAYHSDSLCCAIMGNKIKGKRGKRNGIKLPNGDKLNSKLPNIDKRNHKSLNAKHAVEKIHDSERLNKQGTSELGEKGITNKPSNISAQLEPNQALVLGDTLKSILSFLDWKTLLDAELVSQAWHDAIQNNHLWKKLYIHQVPTDSSLKLLHKKHGEPVFQSAIHESIYYKNLFVGFNKLKQNWDRGRYIYKEKCLEETSISFVAMDQQRIFVVLRKKHPHPVRIKIYNRWNLEAQHTLNADNDLITDIMLKNDIMFSAHFGGKIIMWNLQTYEQVILFQDYEAIEYMPICLAGNLLISGSIVATELDPNCRDSHLTLRRILDEKTVCIEKKIKIHNSRITNIQSYKESFAAFVCSMTFETCLRIYSCESLQLLKTVEMSFAGSNCYAFHNGLLATPTRNGTIEVFNVETQERIRKIEAQKEVRRIEMDSQRIFTCDGDSEITCWDITDESQTTAPFPISAGRGKSFDSYVFDAVQIVTLIDQYGLDGPRKFFLAVWDFLEAN